jgi:hypothetical protein
MLAIDTYTIKEGLMVKNITEKHPDMNKRKLIIANKSSFAGAFIDDGKLGLTGSDKTYIIGDNLELIQKMLKFKISDIISHFTKYRQDFLEKEVYTYLPDIRKLGIEDINEKQFYKLIGLTQNEIKLFDKNYLNDKDNLLDDIPIIEVNDELVDESIIKVKKKKSIKKLSKEDNDELVDESIIKVKKKNQ